MTPFDGLQWQVSATIPVDVTFLRVNTANTAVAISESLTVSGAQKYNPVMVKRLLRAKKGRVNAVPSDEASFIKWLRSA